MNAITHAFRPFESPPQRTPHRRSYRSFDCCVPPSIGGHLRPWRPPPLSNSILVTKPPQTSKPTTARVTPIARRLRMAMGSGGAMIYWHSCPTIPMERERAKPLGVGWQRLIVCVCVVCACFFLCLCFVDCRVGAPTTTKLSPPQHSADDGPPREMSTTQSSSHTEDD